MRPGPSDDINSSIRRGRETGVSTLNLSPFMMRSAMLGCTKEPPPAPRWLLSHAPGLLRFQNRELNKQVLLIACSQALRNTKHSNTT